MVNFHSVKQMWKWNNEHVTNVGQTKEKNLSSRQDTNLWPPNHLAGALNPLDLSYGEFELMDGELGYIYIVGSYLTRVLHTARISNIEIVLYGERMKDGKF